MSYIHDDFISGYSCHRCGAPLIPIPITRIISSGSMEHAYYSAGVHRTPVDDIELSGYDYHCPICKKETSAYDQYHIHRVQKRKGDDILTDYELRVKVPRTENLWYWLRLLKRYVVFIVLILVLILSRLIYRR